MTTTQDILAFNISTASGVRDVAHFAAKITTAATAARALYYERKNRRRQVVIKLLTETINFFTH